MATKIKRRKDLEDQKINISIDIPMIEGLIKYVRCENTMKKQIAQVGKLLDEMDYKSYNYNPDILDRLNLLKVLCTAITEKGIRDESVLRSYIHENLPESDSVIKEINFEKNQLTDSDCKTMYEFINEKLQFIYIYKMKDDVIDHLCKLDNIGFTSFRDVLEPLKDALGRLQMQLQSISAPDELIRSFSFSNSDYFDLLDRVVAKAKKPSTILMTGIRQLNAILSPGFQSGRLYTILGGTGKFKSGTLWNICDQLRLYNPHIKPVENGMRKTILFITMENTIYETIIRLIDMYNPTDKTIQEMTTEEVAQILRDEGHFMFTSDDGIDIEMRYYSDLEIATSHIYTLVQELADNGKKVIAVILDYILKIDSVKEHYGDERLRISYAGRELKSIAQTLDIVVITAMQINRAGNGILDAAMQENKEDVGRFIGASYVGNCWDLIQESDWVCFINLEMQKSTGKWFLSFKRLKIRGKKDPLALDYFNHPFVNNNGIRLEPDVDKPEPVSIISLASDLVSVDEDTTPNNMARPRQRISDVQSKQNGMQNKALQIPLEGLVKAC